MSRVSENLNKRREALGLDVKTVAAELNRRGIDIAYSTVAAWFNGARGERWKVDELRALLDILQTDLETMAGGEAELVSDPLAAAVAREMRELNPAQQQAVLAMIKVMRNG